MKTTDADNNKPLKLDRAPVGLSHHLVDSDRYEGHKLPTCEINPLEPEVKWLLPKKAKMSVFSDIRSSLPATPFKHKHANQISDHVSSGIFLADNAINVREPLLSIALDTSDFRIMRETGMQFRVRGPFLHEFAHMADYHESITRGQGTIKDLFSKLAAPANDAENDIRLDRIEVESPTPSRDISNAAADFIADYLANPKNANEPIYRVLSKIDAKDLNVTALCYTPRVSYNMIVHIPEHDAFVEWESCSDPNTFFTPHSDHIAGQDKEFEAEAKRIYTAKGSKVTDEQLITIYETSKERIIAHIEAHFPEFSGAQYSKVERATRAVGQHYTSSNGQVEQIADTFTSNVSLSGFPYRETNVQKGMVHAARLGVKVDDVICNRATLASLVKKLVSPNHVIATNNGIEIVGDECAKNNTSPDQLRIA